MKKNNTLSQIVAAIKKGKSFFITGHQNPDGDSLGSTLALTSLLRRMDKEVYPFSKDRPGDDLFFLPDLNKVNFSILPTEHNYDTLIMLECSEPTRGGNLDICFKNAKQVINIDHHITGQFYGDFNYIDAKASSTAEIMVLLFKEMNARPTANEATCLYTGLVTDTARFLHSNTTPESMAAGAFLLECGADIKTINTIIYNTKPYPEMKLLGRALEKLKLHHKGQIAEISLLKSDFKKLKTDPRHTQGIVSQPIMVPSVEVSLLLREEPGKVAVNLRSKGKVDVSAVAQEFGGGGHARAAGFKIAKGNLETIKKKLLKAVKEKLK